MPGGSGCRLPRALCRLEPVSNRDRVQSEAGAVTVRLPAAQPGVCVQGSRQQLGCSAIHPRSRPVDATAAPRWHSGHRCVRLPATAAQVPACRRVRGHLPALRWLSANRAKARLLQARDEHLALSSPVGQADRASRANGPIPAKSVARQVGHRFAGKSGQVCAGACGGAGHDAGAAAARRGDRRGALGSS